MSWAQTQNYQHLAGNTAKSQFKTSSGKAQNLQQSSAPHIKNIQTIPQGLPNLGNTCFLNSILQFLYAADTFKQYLINKQGNKNYYYNQKDVSQIVGRIFFCLQNRQRSHLIPNLLSQFMKILEKINISYKSFKQEDGLQTLLNLLNQVQMKHNDAIKCFNIQCERKCRCGVHTVMGKHIELTQQYCGHCKQIFQRNNSNYAKYIICVNYKGHEPPSNLIEKIKKNGQSIQRIYKLISSIKYSGMNYSGHYTTSRLQNQKWYIFNDRNVEQTTEKAVLQSKGCILLYQMIHPSELQRYKKDLQQVSTISSNVCGLSIDPTNTSKIRESQVSSENGEINGRKIPRLENNHNLNSQAERNNMLQPKSRIQVDETYLFKLKLISGHKDIYAVRWTFQSDYIMSIQNIQLTLRKNYQIHYCLEIDNDIFFYGKDSRIQLAYEISILMEKQAVISAERLREFVETFLNYSIRKRFHACNNRQERQIFLKKLNQSAFKQFTPKPRIKILEWDKKR